jgi:hypothetical protein
MEFGRQWLSKFPGIGEPVKALETKRKYSSANEILGLCVSSTI